MQQELSAKMASFLKDGGLKVGSVSAAITNDPKFSAALAAAINSVISNNNNNGVEDHASAATAGCSNTTMIPALAAGCSDTTMQSEPLDLNQESSLSSPPTGVPPHELDLAMARSDQHRSERAALGRWNSG